MPGASDRHEGGDGEFLLICPLFAADRRDYFYLLRMILLGITTHSVNSPRNAPAAVRAIILPPDGVFRVTDLSMPASCYGGFSNT